MHLMQKIETVMFKIELIDAETSDFDMFNDFLLFELNCSRQNSW